MNRYVFDTSALFTYFDKEEGADDIQEMVLKAIQDNFDIFLSVVALIEVYYKSCQEQDDEIANERIERLMKKPFSIIDIDMTMIEIIGSIKAKYQLSFADSCIVGLAKIKKAKLVHKDPEFEVINEIPQFVLPYKEKKSK